MPDPGRIPGPIVIPNCIEVFLRWNLANGKSARNALHAIVGSGFVANTAGCNIIQSAINGSGAFTTFKPFLNSATLFAGVSMRDLRAANMPLVDSTGGGVAGTGGGNALPPEVALAVTLRTDRAGRAFRGRTYLPGFDDSSLNPNGTAVAGLTSAAAGFMSEVSAALLAEGMTLAIGQPARQAYTGVHGSPIPARGANAVPVTAIVVRDNVFDSQRRRSKP